MRDELDIPGTILVVHGVHVRPGIQGSEQHAVCSVRVAQVLLFGAGGDVLRGDVLATSVV